MSRSQPAHAAGRLGEAARRGRPARILEADFQLAPYAIEPARRRPPRPDASRRHATTSAESRHRDPVQADQPAEYFGRLAVRYRAAGWSPARRPGTKTSTRRARLRNRPRHAAGNATPRLGAGGADVRPRLGPARRPWRTRKTAASSSNAPAPTVADVFGELADTQQPNTKGASMLTLRLTPRSRSRCAALGIANTRRSAAGGLRSRHGLRGGVTLRELPRAPARGARAADDLGGAAVGAGIGRTRLRALNARAMREGHVNLAARWRCRPPAPMAHQPPMPMNRSNRTDGLVVVHARDEVNRALAGHGGRESTSPPHQHCDALALVALLLEQTRRARRTRSDQLEPAASRRASRDHPGPRFPRRSQLVSQTEPALAPAQPPPPGARPARPPRRPRANWLSAGSAPSPSAGSDRAAPSIRTKPHRR